MSVQSDIKQTVAEFWPAQVKFAGEDRLDDIVRGIIIEGSDQKRYLGGEPLELGIALDILRDAVVLIEIGYAAYKTWREMHKKPPTREELLAELLKLDQQGYTMHERVARKRTEIAERIVADGASGRGPGPPPSADV